MYFPLGVARRLRPSAASTCDDAPPLPSSLAGLAKLGGAREEVAMQVARDSEGELFAVMGEAEVSIWSVRPALLLAKVIRTPLSLRTLGPNIRIVWHESSSGETGLVVQTSRDRLLYYALDFSPKEVIYRAPMGNPQTSAFRYGTGEADQVSVVLKMCNEVDMSLHGCSAICATEGGLLVATTSPIGLRWLTWQACAQRAKDSLTASNAEPDPFTAAHELEWLADPAAEITGIEFSPAFDLFALLTSDGCAYTASYVSKASHLNRSTASLNESGTHSKWRGSCLHGGMPSKASTLGDSAPSTAPVTPQMASEGFSDAATNPSFALPAKKYATSSAFNASMSLLSIGLLDGSALIFALGHGTRGTLSHINALRTTLNSTASHLETGSITSMAWTSDGYALAIGWQRGWSLWSVYGRLLCWGVANAEDNVSAAFEDSFMQGVSGLFWGPGDLELFLLCPPRADPKGKVVDEQLYSLPLARSAVTGIHSPDNTNQGFLQLDDRVLVYRGADQPDMSVINPESDVWQNIKIPPEYLYANWPLRCTCISADSRLIAVAGRRGIAHYNSLSGRWKVFENEAQEQSFYIRGGMQWYSGFLVAGIVEDRQAAIRIFTRDRPLTLSAIVSDQRLDAEIVHLAIFDNSLLVYCADNTLHHFLLDADEKLGICRLRLCSSIGFEGVVKDATRVRGMSWLVPRSQQRFGDPADDLNVATIIFLIEGKLVLLRPRKAAQDEVKYDMQVLADRTEFYWTHLSGIGALENSLWAWDGKTIRIWLNALNIETASNAPDTRPRRAVKESVAIVPDFYPLSVLMDKGVIIGVDYETSLRRSLDFAIFRVITQTHLFLHHVLRFHLSRAQIQEAVLFASCYEHLVYFAHALEILLHDVLQDEADAYLASRPTTPVYGESAAANARVTPNADAVLPHVVVFLDYFDEALQVVVGCARKTEIARWGYLFNAVGKPRGLFEHCMEAGRLKVAASYLLVLHNLESIEQSSADTVRLLRAAMAARDWMLCKELLRFLYSLDHSGRLLRQALDDAGALPPGFLATTDRSHSAPNGSLPSFTTSAPPDTLARTPSDPAVPVRPASQGLGFGSLLARVGLGGSSPPLSSPSAFDALRRSSPSPV